MEMIIRSPELSRPDVQARYVPHVTNGLIVTHTLAITQPPTIRRGLGQVSGAGRRSSWPKRHAYQDPQIPDASIRIRLCPCSRGISISR
jgi:hypothetical protein